jgi:hypothetical protein
MPEKLIDKNAFDAILKRLIQRKPITQKEATAAPKLRKDGQPKQNKNRS